MAGSYHHLLDDGGWSMIENMGDACECIEELFWLVERGLGRDRALALLEQEFYPMERGDIETDAYFNKVRSQMEK